MFAHLAVTTWRTVCRDRLHAGLNVLGLALGFAAAVLIGLYLRDEYSYERFLPGWQDVYRVQTTAQTATAATTFGPAEHDWAAHLKLDFPEIGSIARIAVAETGVRHGEVEAEERVYAADPDFFTVLPLPTEAGDPGATLRTPDGIVITRRMALKYFGTDDCIGQTLELDRAHVVRVGAVLRDLPSETTLAGRDFFLSGLAPFGRLMQLDTGKQPPPGDNWGDTFTFLRLAPGASAASIESRLEDFARRHRPDLTDGPNHLRLTLRPLGGIHLDTTTIAGGAPNPATLVGLAVTGLLLLAATGINFVNMATARATKRALEVGIRKAVGATRRQLLVQFMAEALAYAIAAMMLAVATVELVLSRFDAFLDRTIQFDYLGDPVVAATLVAITAGVGLAAGIYPALILSGFRPVEVLSGRGVLSPGSGRLRNLLVAVQFAFSIALLITTAIVYRQTNFAAAQSLVAGMHPVVVISAPRMGAPLETLRDRIAGLPGVELASASDNAPGTSDTSTTEIKRPDHASTGQIFFNEEMADPSFFAMFGIPILAGRPFATDRSADRVEYDATKTGVAILNESAVRRLGFASNADALGQTVLYRLADGSYQPREIVGVVPDFPMTSIRETIPPSIFTDSPSDFETVSVRLTGADLAETLSRIDAAWHDLVPSRPIQRSFFDARIEHEYRDIIRQGRIFAGFSLVAVAIGGLGVFGLSAFAAERRTKEIGIRKALGASTLDVLRLLVWQVTRPVLVANLIAWPAAWWMARRWLDGFAYRIDITPGLFVMAGATALAVALGTTALHTVKVARARPVAALRYE